MLQYIVFVNKIIKLGDRPRAASFGPRVRTQSSQLEARSRIICVIEKDGMELVVFTVLLYLHLFKQTIVWHY